MIAGVKRSQTRFEKVVVAISALTGITVSDQAVRSLISIVSVGSFGEDLRGRDWPWRRDIAREEVDSAEIRGEVEVSLWVKVEEAYCAAGEVGAYE